MRKVTTKVVGAFVRGEAARCGNSSTDGTRLYLHGNLIAERRKSSIYVTLAGWNTPTTRERLNAIPGVRICQRKFLPYFNGQLMHVHQWYRASTTN